MIAPDYSTLRAQRAGDVLEEGDLRSRTLSLPKTSVSHRLNESAIAIWEYCDGTRTSVDIAQRLGRRLGLPERALHRDIAGAIQQLSDLGYVIGVDSALAGVNNWGRLACPQPDLYDIEVCAEIIRRRRPGKPSAPTATSAQHRIFGGAVDVDYRYSCGSGLLRHAPRDHRNILLAEELLRAAWPVAYRGFARMMLTVHPTLDGEVPVAPAAYFGGSKCHSDEEDEFLGTMWSTVNCPYMLAENFVHEMAHQKLFAIGVYKEHQTRLLTNSYAHRFKSPVLTTRPRPMSAMLHGMYAYAYVTELDLHLLTIESNPRLREMLATRASENLLRLCRGCSEMLPEVVVDAEGVEFLRGFKTWVAEILTRGEGVHGAWRENIIWELLDAPCRQRIECSNRCDAGVSLWTIPRVEIVEKRVGLEKAVGE